ncbi:hypothetical protein HPP92_009689 [Vanilla planifolia]|uniref:Uncharacterized protein n=1 Tax=Vanilla planifolia TaxID=51239 RepID=A0A835RAR1_VANPL|nr:hypothetical protein HPP92_009689 [Vanilla planifolia]
MYSSLQSPSATGTLSATRERIPFACPSITPRQLYIPLPSATLFQILIVRSPDPLTTKSPTQTRERIALSCPRSSQVTAMYSAVPSLSHTRIDRSQAPEYSADPTHWLVTMSP